MMPPAKKLAIVLAVSASLAAALLWTSWVRHPRPDAPLTQRMNAAGIRPNVVLVTLDTTRADHLPVYGYRGVETPNLSALAQDGIVFEQCVSQSPFTLPSHSSILTGLYPTFHGVRINGHTALSDAHLTLAEALGQAGYATGGFVGAFVLDGRWGLKQGFDHYDDGFDLRRYKQLDLAGVQRSGAEVMDAALAWMARKKDARFFSWIHIYDAHSPYEPPEPYRTRYAPRGVDGLYDGEIAAADEQVGRLLAWLRDNDLDESTLVVVVGDHGEGLGDHGEVTHGYFIYDYAVRVPLLMRLPLAAARGRRVTNQVRTIDVFPTVLEIAGLEVRGAVQGRSLLSLTAGLTGDFPDRAYSESLSPSLQYGWSPLTSLRTSRYKLIDAPRPELYDLANDPRETRNLVGEKPELADELRALLARTIAETSAGAPEQEPANLDQETLGRLAALGYVGTPVHTPAGVPRADPKDKLEVYNAVAVAAEQIYNDKFREAAEGLEAVLEVDPAVPQAKLLLATCYSKLGRLADAKRQVDAILRKDPGSIHALITMANLLSEEGRGDEVIAICKKALAVDPRNAQAYTLIGEVFMKAGDHRQALTYLRKAVDVQPKLTRNRVNLAAALVGVKDLAAAEVVLKDVLSLNPKFPFAAFHLGLLYEEQGRLPAAREAYAREAEHTPDSVPARFNLGNLLLKLGDREGAKAQMQEVVRLHPGGARGYLFLARLLLAEPGAEERAQKLAEKGLRLAQEPELKALGHYVLADAYSRRGEKQLMAVALARAQGYEAEAAHHGRKALAQRGTSGGH